MIWESYWDFYGRKIPVHGMKLHASLHSQWKNMVGKARWPADFRTGGRGLDLFPAPLSPCVTASRFRCTQSLKFLITYKKFPTVSFIGKKKEFYCHAKQLLLVSGKTLHDCQNKNWVSQHSRKMGSARLWALSLHWGFGQRGGKNVRWASSVGPMEAQSSWNRTLQTLLKSSLFWLQMYNLVT